MRTRVYITSILSEQEGSTWNTDAAAITNSVDNKYKNALIFIPRLHAVFHNGKRYGSMNDIENDASVKSIFNLEICCDNNINSIKLAQKQFENDFKSVSIMVNGALIIPNTESDPPIYNIYMNVGDRAQIFLGYRKGWSWTYNPQNNLTAIVDNNYIIHGIQANPTEQTIYLYNTSIQQDKIAIFNVSVYDSTHNLYSTARNVSMINSFYENGPLASLDDLTIIYNDRIGDLINEKEYTKISNEHSIHLDI